MFSQMWNFVKRHRRKFMVAGAIVGGGIMLSRHLLRKIDEVSDKEVNKFYELNRRDAHFDNTQKTCDQTVLSLTTNLKDGIVAILDSDSLATILKMKPSNKLDVWEELKVMAFTRNVVAIYSGCMLVTVLRVQMNILGGYMYLDAHQPTNKTINAQIPQDVQQKFLASIQHMLGVGLQALTDDINRAVKEIAGPIRLQDLLSISDLNVLFMKIRQELDNSKKHHLKDLSSYMILPYGEGNIQMESVQDDLTLQRIVNETRDIIESADCRNMYSEAVTRSFAHLFDWLVEFYILFRKSNDSMQADFINPHEIRIPVAKLIPPFCNQVFSLCSDQEGQLIQMLLQFEPMKILSANVYEAFSQQECHDDLRNHNKPC